MPRAVLIVRLGALGDLVHALPAAAALRQAWPDARIDWLVDARYQALLGFVPILDHVIVVGGRGGASHARVLKSLRQQQYDVALDLQGLLKSAVMARLTGARRVIGFATPQLREKAAGLFYTDHVSADDGGHVIAKNMSVLRELGVTPGPWTFPLAVPTSHVVDGVRARLGLGPADRFAIVNPGAGWPNKQWPPERFGALASYLASRHRLRSVVLWGPAERLVAEAVAAASDGAAQVAPPTGVGDVMVLARAAALFVAGDTGPLQLAAAVGTPAVGIFGPTNPVRNGPWSAADVCVSRFESCECHHKRRCRRRTACIHDISVDDVIHAAERRLLGASDSV